MQLTMTAIGRASTCIVIVLVAATSISLTAAFDGASYANNFVGDGTYYGPTDKGHCAFREKLPRTFANMLGVSLSFSQYANSASCGACIEFYGTGRGSSGTKIGTHKQYAYVHDSCHDCATNDLDLSKNGDGRHQVVWKFVPCPVDDVQILFEGSNTYYKKYQIRGTVTPILSAALDGKPGLKTPDNFFVSHGHFPSAASIVAKDVFGNEYRIHASVNVADGLVIPNSVSKNGNPLNGGSNPRPGARKPGATCARRGTPCSASRKCCSGSVCQNVAWAASKRCVKHSPPKCIHKYRFCTGPRKPNGARSCCGRLVCKHSRGLRFKRCLSR